ncbi:MAG: hypothetical protein ACKO47_03390 [Alphaproteobacteria bacterium]
MADERYAVFSSALKTNIPLDGNDNRFIKVFNHLMTVVYRLQQNSEIVQNTLINILTNQEKRLNAPTRTRTNADFNEVKSFSSFLDSISNNKTLALFKDLIGLLNQQRVPDVVSGLVNALCDQRTFKKRNDSDKIETSFLDLLKIINDHSGPSLNDNIKRLMKNQFFKKEILESFTAEEGFEKMKSYLFIDDEEKNEYIKNFVLEIFAENSINIEQEKLSKLDYYIRQACKDNEDEIFKFKNKIIENLYNQNISCKLDKSFWNFILKQEGPITLTQMRNLIIHLGSIKTVTEELSKRGNKGDCKIEAAIHGGRENVIDDCEFLRKVLQRNDENLLKELFSQDPQLINENQIFASVDLAENNQSFKPIRNAFQKNQDLSSLKSLVLLFSELSEANKQSILRDLIPEITQNQQANQQAQGGPAAIQPLNISTQNNILIELLEKNFDLAKFLIDTANKEGFQRNIQSSLNYFINNKPIRGRNFVALLDMISDNGPLSLNTAQGTGITTTPYQGDELFKQLFLKFTRNENIFALLLDQNNPGALALIIKKALRTQGMPIDIKRLFGYLNSSTAKEYIVKDNCQNSLIFLNACINSGIIQSRQFIDMKTGKKIALPDFITKETTDQGLIKVILNAIFIVGKTKSSNLDKVFKEYKINPFLEAGNIFKHFTEKEIRSMREVISLGLGKQRVLRRDNTTLPHEISDSTLFQVFGYNVGEHNHKLDKNTAQRLTTLLKDAMVADKNFYLTHKEPLTVYGRHLTRLKAAAALARAAGGRGGASQPGAAARSGGGPSQPGAAAGGRGGASQLQAAAGGKGK